MAPPSKRPTTPQILRADVRRSVSWRVSEIHRHLSSGRYPNCATLAREIEVSPKTIQRDISFMRDQRGMPIAYDEVRHGYYYTHPTTEFPPLQLSRGELVALFIARKSLQPLRGTKLERTLTESLQKIAHACPEDVSFRWEDLDEAFSVKAGGTVKADAQMFSQLLGAVMNGRVLTFHYHKLNSQHAEVRRVHPYHVGQLDHGWYLIGHDVEREDIRTFAFQRMSEVRVQAERFLRPTTFKVSDYLSSGFGVWGYTGNRTGEEVAIKFSGYAARVVAERLWHPSQTLTPMGADGSELVFRATLSGLEEVTRWVLSWGRYARVLGPAALRDRVQEELRHMAAQGVDATREESSAPNGVEL